MLQFRTWFRASCSWHVLPDNWNNLTSQMGSYAGRQTRRVTSQLNQIVRHCHGGYTLIWKRQPAANVVRITARLSTIWISHSGCRTTDSCRWTRTIVCTRPADEKPADCAHVSIYPTSIHADYAIFTFDFPATWWTALWI